MANQHIQLGFVPNRVVVDQSSSSPPLPNTIANLNLWLRADQVVSGVDGTAFTTLNDLSTNAAVYTNSGTTKWLYNASNASFGNKPTISDATGTTKITTTTSNAPGAQPFTCYALCSSTSLSSYQIIISGSDDAAEFGLQSSAYYGYTPASHFGTATSGAHAICGVFNGSSTLFYVDNSATPISTKDSNPTSALNGNIVIGYTVSLDSLIGSIAEVLTYTGAHTSAQVKTVFTYLANRYSQSFS